MKIKIGFSILLYTQTTTTEPNNNNNKQKHYMNAKDSSDDELIQLQSDLKDLKVREA